MKFLVLLLCLVLRGEENNESDFYGRLGVEKDATRMLQGSQASAIVFKLKQEVCVKRINYTLCMSYIVFL